MNKDKTATRWGHIFIAVQYIAAILVIVFFKPGFNDALEFVKNLLFYVLIFMLPIWLWIRYGLKEKPFRYLGFNANSKALGTGFIVAVGMALIFLITNGFQIKRIEWNTPGVLLLIGTALAGLFEEIVFRGFSLTFFKQRTGFVWANIITALMFSLLHFQEVLEQNAIQLAVLFGIGLFLGYVYEKLRSIWVPIIIHAAFNILIFLFR